MRWGFLHGTGLSVTAGCPDDEDWAHGVLLALQYWRVSAQPYQDPRLAGVYQRGNAMPTSSLQAWVDKILSLGPVDRSATLDVGTGTGMFAAALAAADVSGVTVGVDPSPAMLMEALRFNSHPRVRYVAGEAGALPIAANSIDLALLSRVIHHLPDRRRCARELRRVLRPGGVVVVRTTVRERLDAVVYDYWPRLRELDQARFPSAAMIVGDFETAGFAVTASASFSQPVQPSLRAFHDVLASRPQSKFDMLTADEFATGLTRLRQDADVEAYEREVRERYDVLAFSVR